MRDPYASLGSELAAAAARKEAHRRERGVVLAWLSHRLNVATVATMLVFAGGAVAVAATGLLSGAPVKPEVPISPVAGNGLPVPGNAHGLALRAADPGGGLPWGMRVLHTTRGQDCVQVARERGGQLGELGLDSAFGDDGRFHALPSDVLPPGYGGSASYVECVLPGHTLIFEDTSADRSAERLLPEEFSDAPPGRKGKAPPVRDLRALSFGLLGPHAVSVTYRTPTGLRTVPVSGPDGAFLIVEPAGYITGPYTVGGSSTGQAAADSVDVLLPTSGAGSSGTMVRAATFRFGAHVCSQGAGAPVSRTCPRRHMAAPHRWFQTTRSLHRPVHLRLLLQSRAACKAAFLNDPCYKGRVEFTAPYAITAAGADYEVEAVAKCKVGGRPETAWGLERDVRHDEAVSTDSLGRFVFTPACASQEKFVVRYVNRQGPSTGSPHVSVIIGAVAMSKATFPNGAPVSR
jgi:hypothetical protein